MHKAREACGVVVDMIRAKKMAGRALLLTGLHHLNCSTPRWYMLVAERSHSLRSTAGQMS
jgi:TIP49 P-loop domain